ncbi:Glyco_hydro_17 domain-containing protein/X8 domain-containing protein [Cephalotus follicularis]|uniref:glucan endo-1,3-beta-D-glucosidase n=1 Tax=Cephalotus follicularis TaxID=3775 RepID=A0A1Q3BMB7_CEPFO|nr:Glyco_hydro_17 domain-containing protein/X8 domain-containing protein [Cephalotus follicularis]
MARAVYLLWAIFTLLGSANIVHGSGSIGVNWGTLASHPLPPNIVVGMLKDNGITKVKIFDADSWTVSALAGTNIEVMVGIPNDQLKTLADSYGDCKDWVKENVTKHIYNGGVNIKYVAVGNEPFLTSYNGSYLNTTFPALKNIQKALNEAGHGDQIKATVPLNADVYESSTNQPSDGDFRSDIKDLMLQIVRFFHDNDAPFVVNIYPFLSLYENDDFPFEFAFFGGGSNPLNDKGLQYNNVFDANYDTLVWSLKKAGIPNLKIVVGEVGWPTDGNKNGNVKLAQKFYDGLLKKLASNKGTPLRPGKLEVYLFGLLDEDLKSIAPGFFERHWGIFRYDGQPKFPIDFTGQGQEKMPIGAKGVQYLPSQWCVLNKAIRNTSEVPPQVDYACSLSDCTSLSYGSTCNNLDFVGNVSYAFNMYFQMQDQDVRACDFGGMAQLVSQNASKGTCLFPIQIVSASERLSFAYTATIAAGILVSFFMLM